MTEDEWLRRYAARIMERARTAEGEKVTQAIADALAHAEPFAVLSEFFEDDPEDAADEEMSYWDD